MRFPIIRCLPGLIFLSLPALGVAAAGGPGGAPPGRNPEAARAMRRRTDLGTLGGPVAIPNAINQRGQIVGRSTTADVRSHAFLWEDGLMIDLGTLGGSASNAVDINQRGQIIGVSNTWTDDVHPFFWQEGVMTDLGTPGGPFSSARYINARGRVLVEGNAANLATRVFVWQRGAMADLGSLGGGSSYANSMNERGQVVGYSETPTETHAYLWQDGVLTDLGTAGGRLTIATAINEEGDVVGFSETPAHEIHASLWQVGGKQGQVADSPSALPGGPAGVGAGGQGAAPMQRAGSPAPEPSAATLRILSPPGVVPVEFEMRHYPGGHYRASVYDVRGRLVRRRERDAAATHATWDGGRQDGGRVSTGMYFLRVESEGRGSSAKVVVTH